MKGQYKKGNVNVTYRIPRELNEKLELLTRDPMSGRSAYGLKSEIVTELTEKFLEAFLNKRSSIDIQDVSAKIYRLLNKE